MFEVENWYKVDSAAEECYDHIRNGGLPSCYLGVVHWEFPPILPFSHGQLWKDLLPYFGSHKYVSHNSIHLCPVAAQKIKCKHLTFLDLAAVSESRSRNSIETVRYWGCRNSLNIDLNIDLNILEHSYVHSLSGMTMFLLCCNVVQAAVCLFR